MKKELLRIKNGRLSQSQYGSLDGICLNLLAGETLGIIFANLYEKEKLLNVLRADTFLTSGRMYLNEQTVTSGTTIQQNVYVISKGSTLSDKLSLCENIYFTKLPPLLFKLDIYREMLEDLLEQFQLPIALDAPVNSLSHCELICLELVKAYVLKKKIIVLADLTAYLTSAEMKCVLDLTTQMKKENFGVVLIESFWDVIFKHADHIAIIKYGQTTGLYPLDGFGAEELRSALWKELTPCPTDVPSKYFSAKNDEILTFRHIQTNVLKDISFSLDKGRLMKILCLDEKSRCHLLSLLRGQSHPQHGEIYLRQNLFSPVKERDAQRLGLYIVEDNPQEKMLLRNMSVFDNLGIMLSKRVHNLWLNLRFQRNLQQTIREICDEDFWDEPLSQLNPMQLQKLTYCKWLLLHPAVIVCINPFTGMDYQVDSITESMLSKVCARGTAVMILASYLPENKLEGKSYRLENGVLWVE